MPVDEYLRLLDEKRVEPAARHRTARKPGVVPGDSGLEPVPRRLEAEPATYQLLRCAPSTRPNPSRGPCSCGCRRVLITPELDAALEDPIRLGQAIRDIGRYSLARFDHRTNSLQMHGWCRRPCSSG